MSYQMKPIRGFGGSGAYTGKQWVGKMHHGKSENPEETQTNPERT